MVGGVLSGLLSVILAEWDVSTLIFQPGIFFGLFFAMLNYKAIKLYKKFLVIAISTIAYYLAVQIAFMGTLEPNFIKYSLGGLLGASIMTFSFWALLGTSRSLLLFIIPVAGGILGGLFILIGSVYVDFALWQGAIMCLLAVAFIRKPSSVPILNTPFS